MWFSHLLRLITSTQKECAQHTQQLIFPRIASKASGTTFTPRKKHHLRAEGKAENVESEEEEVENDQPPNNDEEEEPGELEAEDIPPYEEGDFLSLGLLWIMFVEYHKSTASTLALQPQWTR